MYQPLILLSAITAASSEASGALPPGPAKCWRDVFEMSHCETDWGQGMAHAVEPRPAHREIDLLRLLGEAKGLEGRFGLRGMPPGIMQRH